MTKKLILNFEQKKAIEKILLFLKNNDIKVFILKGYAGTGKTTLLKELIDKYSDIYNFIPLASTGAASKVLSQKIEKNSKTVHSDTYKFNKIEEKYKDQFEYKFDIKRNITSLTDVFIIDEASMISNEQAEQDKRVKFGSEKLLQDFLKQNNAKIIFVGDPMQLPPIGAENSIALEKENLEKIFNIKCEEVTLKKIMRQNNQSSIQEESIKLRKCFEEKERYTLKSDNKNIFDINYDDISKFYCANLNDTGIITFSNREALLISNKIRKLIFGKSLKKIQNGEKLLVIFNNHKIGVMNGNIIKVTKIISSKIIPVELEHKEKKVIKLEFIKATIEKENGESIDTYILLNFLNDSLYPKDEKYISDALTKLSLLKGEDTYNSVLFNALRVRYGYAITCHKAQGNEFNNVILENRSTLNDFDYKWLYTGITRARNNIYLFKSQYNEAKLSNDLENDYIEKNTYIEEQYIKNHEKDKYIIELIKLKSKKNCKKDKYIIQLL